MKFFERIKQIFFGNKSKRISENIDVRSIVKAVKSEKDAEIALNIIRNYIYVLPSSDLIELVLALPQKSQIKGIEIASKHITPYDLCEMTIKKLDYNSKIDVLEKYHDKLDLEDIFGIFNSLTPDKRSIALSKCIDHFDSLGLSEIISNYIPLYERLDCLNKYQDLLDGFSKANIISNLDTQRKIDALKLYAKEINKTDLNNIVCNSNTNKIPELLDIVYNYLTAKQISDIIQLHVPNEKKLESLYKCCSKLNSSTISDIIKYSIPEEQKGEALIALQNRIKSNNIGEILQFCIQGKKVLEKVKHNLDSEDLDFFTKQL